MLDAIPSTGPGPGSMRAGAAASQSSQCSWGPGQGAQTRRAHSDNRAWPRTLLPPTRRIGPSRAPGPAPSDGL
jgi:hypothetical protein